MFDHVLAQPGRQRRSATQKERHLSAIRQCVQVATVTSVADDVVHLVLEPTGPEPLQTWAPGAHIDVELEPSLVRQYSLCGDPGNTEVYEIAVLRCPDGRGGSTKVHQLKVGAKLRISTPRNNFALHQSRRYLFVAGGIGITPLLPMIDDVAKRGVDWTLVYGGRARASMAFADRLEERYGEHVHIVPQDTAGLIDLASALTPVPDTLVYCCGPEGLLDAVAAICAANWSADSLLVERFTSTPQTTKAAPFSNTSGERRAGDSDSDGPTPDGSVEVQLGHDGPVIDVPADTSILSALIDAGVDIFYSCQEGICGSCETNVLEGEPEHRDQLLTPMERQAGAMLVCVSRATSRRLVLDLDPP